MELLLSENGKVCGKSSFGKSNREFSFVYMKCLSDSEVKMLDRPLIQ